MSEYLVLIYGDESAFENSDPEMFNEMMEGHATFGTNNAGALRGGNALEMSNTAKSIRSDEHENFTITEGPFTTAKESLGGYYVIEATDIDEAVAIAKQIPMPFGGVEIRPIRVFD